MSSRNVMFAGAVLAFGLVVLNIMLTSMHARRLHTDTQAIAHTQAVVDELSLILSALIDAETSERGYLITGDQKYLEPFLWASNAMRGLLDRLAGLVEQDRDQLERVQSLRSKIRSKFEEFEQSIRVRDTEGFEAARALFDSDVGKNQMDELRGSIESIRSIEERQRDVRSIETASKFSTNRTLNLLSGLAALAAVGLYIVTSRRYTLDQVAYAREIELKSDLLQTTLSSIGDGVITTDLRGAITNLNAVAEDLTRWSREDAQGKPLNEVLNLLEEGTRGPMELVTHEPDGYVSVKPIRSAILRRRDGSEILIDDSAAPIRDSQGALLGWIVVFHDVTDLRDTQNQLQRNEQTFRALFDLAPIGIANISLDGQLLRVNKMFCDIVDMPREDLMQNSAFKLTHPDDLHRNEIYTERLLQGQDDSFSMDKRYVNNMGKVIWVNVSETVLRDKIGQPQSFIAAVKDIRSIREADEIRIRMSSIVRSSNDAIISKNCDGRITSWNPAAERMFGYTESEMIGTSVLKIVPEDRHQEEIELLRRLAKGELIEQYKMTRLHRNGTRLEVLLNISPIFDGERNLLGLSTIVRDLTAEIRSELELKESELRFRTLADKMSQFAWMADALGQLYWFNKRWYEYTGTELEDVKGWGWTRLIHPDHTQRVVKNFRHSWDMVEPWEDTFLLKGQNGQYRWFLSRAQPIYDTDGHVVNWFGSNTDITELKEQEESLNRARQIAEAASQARGEFLANMSHEIRTPMTAILGHTDILGNHLQDPDDLQSIDTIRRNGKFLLQIINDILDLSKIDAGKMEIEKKQVSPREVMEEVRALMDVRATEKGLGFDVRLDGRLPRYISSDAVRIRQILLNLVGNAIKFTDKGSVELIGRLHPSGSMVQFDILDTGVGISPIDLERLFKPFVQADSSSTRAFEGAGLGLAISQRLARALGGDISVASQLGHSSQFTLNIPCSDADLGDMVDVIEPIDKPSLAERLGSIDGYVLVVDDRRDIRLLAQNIIETAGGRVSFATNGLEAIEKLTHDMHLNTESVDAVLMDMQMPIMDGYKAASELRRLGFRKPIIALTANAMKDDRDKCLASGCDDYATKPLDGPSLVNLLAQHISNSRKAVS